MHESGSASKKVPKDRYDFRSARIEAVNIFQEVSFLELPPDLSLPSMAFLSGLQQVHLGSHDRPNAGLYKEWVGYIMCV
jgi:hypothetical protein